MNLYFIGIGGSGIGPLAILARDLGHKVSGSDRENSLNFKKITSIGIETSLDQSGKNIENKNKKNSIDWIVYSSSVPKDHPEIVYAKRNAIKTSKRHEFINLILEEQKLKLVMVTGTHGKTTTTSMLLWLFRYFKISVSHIIGTTFDWARPAGCQQGSKYLILEGDEFDKHFLNYKPYACLLTAISFDHPDSYDGVEDYYRSFRNCLKLAHIATAFLEDLKTISFEYWQNSNSKLRLTTLKRFLSKKPIEYADIKLLGRHNRQNAASAKRMFLSLVEDQLSSEQITTIDQALSQFPGSDRRMEKLAKRVYTDYAHHPKEIKATLQMASEINDKLVVVYEPHQNIRQHQIKEGYRDSFDLANKIYWLPTYLTREDPKLEILGPKDLTQQIFRQERVIISKYGSQLVQRLRSDYLSNYNILFFGAGDIDAWARENLEQITTK